MRRFALGYFFRLLLIDNKEKNVANAREKVVELVTLHPWEVYHSL